MSAIRVRALEMKQLVEKTEHDLLPQWRGLNSLSDCRLAGFDCSLDSLGGSLLIPMCVVVVATQALGVLILHEKRLLTLARFDVINVGGGFGPTLNRTFSTLRFRRKPVPLDRLPDG
jgi:hypothetical protein